MNETIGLVRGTGYPLGLNATRYPTEERTLLRVLADRAAEFGDKDWLVFDSTDPVSYARAWSEACRVGNAIERSVGAGAHVGLFLLNQAEFLPCFFGSMVGGGLAVPLNAQARGPLLHHVVEHSDARIVIARTDLLDRLVAIDGLGSVELVVAVGEGDRPHSIHGVPVVAFERWLEGAPDTPPTEFPDYRSPCLIQYTSGTTGRQKGAVYPHQFLYLYAAMYVDSIGHTADTVLTTPLPLFHVAALHLVANAALQAGATAHLKSRFSAGAFFEEVAADGADFAMLLGPMAAIILKTVQDAPPHRLRKVFCVPPPPGLEEFERRYRTSIIWHAFGQTEISPMGMRPDVIPGVERDTLGYPVSWMDFGVVDDHDRLLPPGEVGEIVFRPLRPYSMFTEYYKDPEQTKLALRNFMFHTGDLGHYDTEGLLHYRGRKQERIRRRGENISAPELEFVVLSHPKVVEAAAYGIPSELGEEDVKLDLRTSEPVDPAELHAWIAENVPRYMVPRYLEFRAEFPKTPSERIQKYLLKALPVDRPEVHDFERRP